MRPAKITKNEIDNKSVNIYFSTDVRHNILTKIEPDLSTELLVQQTKSFLSSEHRLSDDFAFRQQFQSWEQPEV
jgi:hypothetical protein